VTKINRRSLLAGSALAATAIPVAGLAKAPPAGKQAAGIYRYKLGDYEMTALYDGVWNRPIDDKFVANVAFAEVQKTLSNSFLPTDKLPVPFTALLVNTGSRLVLLDTGTGGQFPGAMAGSLVENLAAAGIAPAAIDAIVISHFHPDHINGIKTKDDALVFPNAEILVPAPEWAYWMDDAKLSTAPQGLKLNFLNVRRVFKNVKVTQYQPGKEVAPGVTSIAAYGHTPGHVAFAVASGSASMLVLSDTTNHPWLFLRNPEWQAAFDMDGPMAVDTRRRLLDQAVADKMLVQGYHFPFPATGHVTKSGANYDLVPIMWQPAI
jgi:glyoxylase-like metal-dependent hydrolase (beta-lactamase superfamily II)